MIKKVNLTLKRKKSVQNPDARAASTGFAKMSGVYVFYEFYI